MPTRHRHRVRVLTGVTLLFSVSISGLSAIAADSLSAASPSAAPTALPPDADILAEKTETTPARQEIFYQPVINNRSLASPVLMLQEGNRLWIRAEDAEAWNLSLPGIQPVNLEGNRFFSLSAWPGASAVIDPVSLQVSLHFPADFFKKKQTNLSSSKINHLTPPDWGIYMNYTLTDAFSEGQNSVNGLLQPVLFGKWGTGNTQILLTNTPVEKKIVRLLSTWVRDQPDKMKSWRFGDLTTVSGSWSGSVNFGGIQWGSNYALQPEYITFPLPGFRGTAIVPSVLDLYVNNVKTQQMELGPGHFDITSIPLVSGSGDIRIVTTDILGRQQVITGNYFLNTTILNPGLHNFSLEAGIIRQNLGITSADYSQLVLSGTDQYSPNDKTAIELHAEALSYEQAAGIALTRLFPRLSGTLNGSAAFSNNSSLGGKKGAQISLGYSQIAEKFNYGATLQTTSHFFTNMGITPGQLAPKLTAQVFGGVQIGKGSLSFNFTHLVNRSTDSSEIFAATYSRNIFFDIALNMTWINTIRGSSPGKAFYLILTRSLDNQTTASYNGTSQTGMSYQNSWQVQKSLPAGTGFGYSLAEQRAQEETRQAALSYQNNYGTWLAQYTGSRQQQSWYYSATGSLAGFDGMGFMSRQITNSFGVVRVKGFDNVTIYSNNQPVGTTDRSGYFLIPSLVPWQPSDVRMDANTLALNTEIGNTQSTVIPWNNCGILIPFEAKRLRNITLQVKQKNGQPIPEGAEVRLNNQNDSFVSGMDGEIYLTGVNDTNTLSVIWPSHRCNVTFTAPPPDDSNPVPDLGDFTCTDAKE